MTHTAGQPVIGPPMSAEEAAEIVAASDHR
jgi:hypothetical protein